MHKIALLLCLFVALSYGSESLKILGHLPYKNNYNSWFGCDLDKEPCASLNDIWAYSYVENNKTYWLALVGLSNGIDIVNVTDPTNPSRVAFMHGCNNIWRDMKSWGQKIYGISEYTATCACSQADGLCLEKLEIQNGPVAGFYNMTEGRISVPLSSVPPVVAPIVIAEPWSDGACDVIENALNGSIALINSGGCHWSMKFLMAQAAGAAAVIVVNNVDSIIYPGMAGLPDGIKIPGVMIGKSDGLAIKAALENTTVPIMANMSDARYKSNYFTKPEGLTIIDMKDPHNPTLERWVDHFEFAHNVGIENEFGRPYMYVVGMSDQVRNQSGFADISNGGIFAYDISNPDVSPKLVWTFNDSYIHDSSVQFCENSYLLVGAAIYDDLVYIWNVTDFSHPVKLGNFSARHGYAHNVYLDKDCTTLYVTHEIENEPISVWKLFRNETTNATMFNIAPKYIGALAVNQFDGTLPHNVYVNDSTLYAAYYAMGVLAWNISVPTDPQLIAHKDTNPNFTEGFHGVWGLYPHHPQGYIYASDIEAGLFILKLEEDIPESPAVHSDVPLIVTAVFLGLAILTITVLSYVVWKNRSNGYDSLK